MPRTGGRSAGSVSAPRNGPAHSGGDAAALVCHCRRVPYRTVRGAIEKGAASTLADVQRTTDACTRCFGCRFEIERLLQDHLGDAYVHTAHVARPEPRLSLKERLVQRLRPAPAPLPKRMYMPVLAGYRGYDITTRVVLFNWGDGPPAEDRTVSVRADLLALDGSRLEVWRAELGHGGSRVLDVGGEAGQRLPDGAGVLKLVIDTDRVGSLRPYFHLIAPAGITSTHEKSAPRLETVSGQRNYYWIFPIGYSARPEEAYLFFTNAETRPIDRHQVVWRSEHGDERAVSLPTIELDQSVCLPLHEYFPEVGSGVVAGSVRISPSTHVVAGFMLRHEPNEGLWRVQHL